MKHKYKILAVFLVGLVLLFFGAGSALATKKPPESTTTTTVVQTTTTTTVPETTTTMPETTVPETTVVETTTPEVTVPPTTEVCVPEGNVITDVATGNQYVYGIPTKVGFNTCDERIPEICVFWGLDETDYSYLWSGRPCAPVQEVADPPDTTTAVLAEAQQLPSTGATEQTPYLVALGLVFLLGGGALTVAARRNRNF